jgi:hypothetical protein
MFPRLALAIVCSVSLVSAQATPPDGFKQRGQIPLPADTVQVDTGTHVLLSMINSVSTKQAQVGDRLYLETAFPIIVNRRTVIPQRSWVTGTVTSVKRPGRVKGHGELQVRFDSLTLPNGTSRKFNSDLGALDARENQTLNREKSKVVSPGGKKEDATTVIAGTAIGAGIGAAAGRAAGAGMGAGIGAAAGLLGVLLTRGPEAILPKGSTVEMILDRPLIFSRDELDVANDSFKHQDPMSSTPVLKEKSPE